MECTKEESVGAPVGEHGGWKHKYCMLRNMRLEKTNQLNWESMQRVYGIVKLEIGRYDYFFIA